MENDNAKVVCDISGVGGAKEPLVKISFTGPHISKRTLLSLVRAIKANYRRHVREYRAELREKQVNQKEKDDSDAERTEDRPENERAGKQEDGRIDGNKSPVGRREEPSRVEQAAGDRAKVVAAGKS